MTQILSLLLLYFFLSSYVHAQNEKNNENKFKIGARIGLDSGWIDSPKHSYHKNNIRRARVHIKGEIADSYAYEVEHTFTGSNNWTDVYIKYLGIDNWEIYAGNMWQPFGMEAITSSRHITFMERALAEFYNPRKLGVMGRTVHNVDDNVYTFALGVFDKSLDNLINKEDYGTSAVGRVTYANIGQESDVFHLGLAAAHTSYDKNYVNLGTDAGSNLYDGSFIETTIKDIENSTRVGLEMALVSGSFSFQGEYIAFLARKEQNTYKLNGWYAQMSWFATGESRPYKASTATFGQIQPNNPIDRGGMGAVEFALRITGIDLRDYDKDNGKEYGVGLEINWYLMPNLRLMTNYTYTNMLKDSNDDAKVFQLRTQYDF